MKYYPFDYFSPKSVSMYTIAIFLKHNCVVCISMLVMMFVDTILTKHNMVISITMYYDALSISSAIKTTNTFEVFVSVGIHPRPRLRYRPQLRHRPRCSATVCDPLVFMNVPKGRRDWE